MTPHQRHLQPGRPGTSRAWPLRARLIALTIALLVPLGVAVGTATEIYLARVLDQQLDDRLTEAAQRAGFTFDRPPPAADRQQPPPAADHRPPPGPDTGWVIVQFDDTGYDGGIVAYSAAAGSYFQLLPGTVEHQLRSLAPNGQFVTVDLDTLGSYRVISSLSHNQTVRVTAVSLSDTHAVLVHVAAVISGTVALASLLAGWAGALMIRRALQPLARVAATATHVSELKLDRGDVDLSLRVAPADTDERTEVGKVGAALNRMLDHVGEALEFRHTSETSIRQFVADASHELRTPLASILGYAELSRRRPASPNDLSHMFSRVESEANRMKILVEDLLLLASLDAGRPLAREPVDLTALLINAAGDAHAAGPHHTWNLDLPHQPATVVGDTTRLQQILANLLANAHTHTPQGTTVTVGLQPGPAETVITVTDNGPGIPAEKLPDIFGRFVRGDNSRSRAAGSTGLGLAIVQAVAAAHHGRTTVASTPGHTQFAVHLPNHPTGIHAAEDHPIRPPASS